MKNDVGDSLDRPALVKRVSKVLQTAELEGWLYPETAEHIVDVVFFNRPKASPVENPA